MNDDIFDIFSLLIFVFIFSFPNATVKLGWDDGGGGRDHQHQQNRPPGFETERSEEEE